MLYLLRLFGFFSFAFVCFISSAVVKNQHLLADMREHVSAVRQFQKAEGRLSSEEELDQISSTIPRPVHRLDYMLTAPPKQILDEQLAGPIPAGGWAISLWRGESFDHYTSWNDRYTLSGADSVWEIGEFWGSLICFAFVAFCSYHRRRSCRSRGVTDPDSQLQQVS